jgi:hypothetical protein
MFRRKCQDLENIFYLVICVPLAEVHYILAIDKAKKKQYVSLNVNRSYDNGNIPEDSNTMAKLCRHIHSNIYYVNV